MKKMFVLAALAAFAAPVFAGDKYEGKAEEDSFKGPRQEMMQKDPAFAQKMQAMKAERKAHKAKMKATEEKLENLVKEYKKAKAGSKKQAAAREEIGQILGQVREEQIAFRTQQIANFEARLAHMKARLAEEQSAGKKAEWISQMTERVIEEDGDLGDALEHHGHMGKDAPQGPMHKGAFQGGPNRDKHGPAADILPVPPTEPEEK